MIKKFVSLLWGQEEEKPEGRNDLPPEIMRKIFSMLEYKSDLKAVSLVCRYWHSVARDPLLWMNAFVDPPGGSPFASIYRVRLETKDVTLDPMHENWKLLVLRSVSMYSLNEAIQCAGLDGYAFVRKGVHDIPERLPFLPGFCRKVVIMGVSREESILQCHAGGLIRYVSQKGYLKLKNLTIVQKDDGKGENDLAWVISSAGSGLVVEDCTIKGVHGVFGLHTENCMTVVKNCDISSERSSVVYAKENAKATFIGCKVHSGKSAGFEMCGGADLTIINCEVFNNKVGFHYYNSAKGTVEGCRSHHNSLSGCFLRSDSNPTITKTVFHNSPYGIASSENGGGVFQDVVVHTCDESGVFFRSASTTEIRKSKICNNDTGVLYLEGSSGMVIESDICANKNNGVSIGDRACVHIEGCKVRGNMSNGIYCFKTVTGIIRGNKIASNKGAILYKIDEQEGLDSDNEIDPDNETVSPEIERCIKRGVCTYTVTQNVFSAHEYYFCNDCDPTYGKCFCASCAKICHVGHRLSKRKFGPFYCDCYKMNCKCKVSKQAQELIEGEEKEEN